MLIVSSQFSWGCERGCGRGHD